MLSKRTCVVRSVSRALPLGGLASLLFIDIVEQCLLVFAYGGMIMTVADDPVDATRHVSTADVANNRSITTVQPRSMLTEPIMIFDGGLDAAVLGDLDPHFLQECPRLANKRSIFARRALPKVHVEWFVANDLRPGR